MQTYRPIEPCPFCGGRAVLRDFTRKSYGFTDYKIECQRCKVSMLSRDTDIPIIVDGSTRLKKTRQSLLRAKLELIATWNRRATKEDFNGSNQTHH